MKITTKGQVTIPQHIREELGLLPHTEVEFEIQEGAVLLRKAEGSQRRGRALIEHMRGRADAGLSTDQIIALTRREE
ncbi:AbrB/MazE/SpoVT family DNA-binding domain-containing protein [soil metagenome]|jgi:AbrB family looped-hinge helix DNA binding protein|nr:AbrB/MazE/SpoVT family DNA-binding domain-containing protein [Gemmatimonadota bacterium]